MHICRADLQPCGPAALPAPPPWTLRTRRLAASIFRKEETTRRCLAVCSLRSHTWRPPYGCRSTSGRSRWVQSGCRASCAHNAVRLVRYRSLLGTFWPSNHRPPLERRCSWSGCADMHRDAAGAARDAAFDTLLEPERASARPPGHGCRTSLNSHPLRNGRLVCAILSSLNTLAAGVQPPVRLAAAGFDSPVGGVGWATSCRCVRRCVASPIPHNCLLPCLIPHYLVDLIFSTRFRYYGEPPRHDMVLILSLTGPHDLQVQPRTADDPVSTSSAVHVPQM